MAVVKTCSEDMNGLLVQRTHQYLTWTNRKNIYHYCEIS